MEQVKHHIESFRDREIKQDNTKKIKKACIVMGAIAVIIATLVLLYGSTDNGLSRMSMASWYRSGSASYQKGEYLSAIKALQIVGSQSRYYDKAVALLEDSYGPYSKEIIN